MSNFAKYIEEVRDLIGSDMDFTREVEQVRDEAKDIVEAVRDGG